MPRLLVALALISAACAPTQTGDTTALTESPTITTLAVTTTSQAPETTTTTELVTTNTAPLVEATWDSWTLVLASVPIGSGAEDEAISLAREVPGSGVLLSNDYPSLNPDYWVVFYGTWAEQPTTDECPDLNDAFTCYPRYLGEPQVATAIAAVGEALVEVDTQSGETVRTIDAAFEGDGGFRGGFALDPSRTYLYYSEGWEDSWYSCETSPGQIGRIDLETGVKQVLDVGSGVTVSPDGNFYAYLTSTQCLPDPENPGFWVLTPYDQVVVVDLIFNEPAFMDTAVLPVDYDDPNALSWVRFHPDGDALVATRDGTVYKVPLGAAPAIQDHAAALTGVEGFPVDVSGNSLIMTKWTGDGFAIQAHDLTTGDVTELWTTELFIQAGIDPAGSIIAAFENWIYPNLTNGITVEGLIGSIDW